MTFTKPEQMLLEAIKAAVRDEHAEWTAPIPEGEWEQFLQLARLHKLLTPAYQAVYACEAAKTASCLAACRRQAILQMAEQTTKTSVFLALYENLQRAGFHPLVVKGIVCRSIWPNPDMRISADEDLLIPESEFFACCGWLEQNGLTPTGTVSPSAYEIGFRGEGNALYIELHRSLFAPDSDAVNGMNLLFRDAHIHARDYVVQDGAVVRSLCPQDHLLYLILHAYKHFIHSGFGIRQVCDIGLWAQCYQEEIDWETLYDQCQNVHAAIFAAAVFAILRESFDMPLPITEKWLQISTDPEPMLRDLLTGGIYGGSDFSRRHSASVTLNAVEAERRGGQSSVLSSVFPPKEKLIRQYPELEQHPARLPIIWVRRMFRYYRETKTTENDNTAESLRIAQERKALLKQYGIIE